MLGLKLKKIRSILISLNTAVSPSSTGSTNPMQGKNLFTRKNHRGSVENKPLPLHHDRVNSNFYGLFSKKKRQVHVMPTIRSRPPPPSTPSPALAFLCFISFRVAARGREGRPHLFSSDHTFTLHYFTLFYSNFKQRHDEYGFKYFILFYF